MALDRQDKPLVLASSRELHGHLAGALGALAGPALVVRKARPATHKLLGVDTAVTRTARKRLKPTSAARWRANGRRVRRLDMLRKASGARRLGRVFQVGNVPGATFGADLHGLSSVHARTLRYAKLRLDRIHLPGVAVDVQMAMLPPAYDPALLPSFAPLERYHREVWLLRTPAERARQPDALNAKEMRLAFVNAVARVAKPAPSGSRGHWRHRHRSGQVGSPVEAALRAAAQVGWTFVSPFVVHTSQGAELSLLERVSSHAQEIFHRGLAGPAAGHCRASGSG